MSWWLDAIFGVVVASVALLVVMLTTTRIAVRYKVDDTGTMDDPGFVVTLEALTNSPSAHVTAIELYGDVAAIYEAMLQAIATARVSITFETYLFWPGPLADRFAEALIARARSGVSVKMLLDADGSRPLPRAFIQALADAGCEVRFFRPFVWYQPIQYNHRTHRKILVVDGAQAFTGGIGVADMWLGPPAWLETMVRVEGDVVGLLQGAFFQNWVIAGGALSLGPRYFPPRPDPETMAREPQSRHAMVTTSSPVWGDSAMRLLYYTAIGAAQRRIWLVSPYFLPNWDTTAALAAAAARGVDVKLLLVGPKNDKLLPYMASRRLYGQLLTAGVRIYEYAPAMMHAKAMIVDDRWTTVGSTNFDPRSFFLNSELNISVDDPAFAAETAEFFAAALADATEITYEAWRSRPWPEHLLGWLGLLIKDQL